MATQWASRVCAAAAVVALACGGVVEKPGGSGNDDPGDEEPVGNPSPASGGRPAAGGASFGAVGNAPAFGGMGTSPGDEYQRCIREASGLGPPGMRDSCGIDCFCDRCTMQMLDCVSDAEGYCMTLLTCSQKTGCAGVGCYAPSTCQAVIDAAPGGGLASISVALMDEVSFCAEPVCAFACP